MFKKNIKWFISKSRFLHLLYIKISCLILKVKFFRLLNKISASNNDIITLPELKKEAMVRIKSNNSKIAHIIGSGWSLNKTIGLVDKNDFVIGFNFSPLSKLDFDIYFIEFGGYKCSETSDFHRMLAEKVVIPSGGNVYFKNIWQERNDVQYIKNHIKGKYPLIKDYVVPCISEDKIQQCLEFCLNSDSNFIAQICSTSITSIILAYFFGFRKIVLHGIDFSGGYFFEQKDFDGYKRYLGLAKKCMYNKHLQTSDQQHPTAVLDIGMKQILPVLKDLLSERGVSLYASSSISPSSLILPAYSKN